MSALENVQALIARLTSRAEEKKTATASDYRALVHQAFEAPESLTPEWQDSVLKAAGKNEADLAADLATMVSRARLREKASSLPQLVEDQRAIEQAQKENDAAFHRAQEALHKARIEHHERAQQYNQEHVRNFQQQTEAKKAAGELVETCKDQELVTMLAELQAERAAAASRNTSHVLNRKHLGSGRQLHQSAASQRAALEAGHAELSAIGARIEAVQARMIESHE